MDFTMQKNGVWKLQPNRYYSQQMKSQMKAGGLQDPPDHKPMYFLIKEAYFPLNPKVGFATLNYRYRLRV